MPAEYNRLSENFTLQEMTLSTVATRMGIDNMPDADQIAALTNLCEHCLQPLRELYQKPIRVTSGFRCDALNTAIKGAKDSQHTRGQAADIQPYRRGPRELEDLATSISIRQQTAPTKFSFDQLILEHWDEELEDYRWLHVSHVSREEDRNMILEAAFSGKKVKYTPVAPEDIGGLHKE